MPDGMSTLPESAPLLHGNCSVNAHSAKRFHPKACRARHYHDHRQHMTQVFLHSKGFAGPGFHPTGAVG